ncbi:MAG: chromosome segregation SMC family protein, partial [Hyphomonadaceae bacterium]
MKLTRLRLIGFKSFVEPTDFQIEPGLTGVVGPNGCGKSNLVEALRWVMGETSHKAMRAADMEAVIFSGSNTRPGRNTAEVGLAIDNADRSAPAQFNEHDTLEITRRIERDAGSTYRINGREVRARDVQMVFADASTGSRSPALVHQGRIGEIIQAKPEQRRRVLEEAAGIAGLHARRHEAELRLRAAEGNLQRVEDVITQLATQIEALKRQARQAIRYRAVSAQVRKAEATLFHLRWQNAQQEVADSEQARDASVREVATATLAQAEAGKRQEAAAQAVPPLREVEASAAAALQRLVIARETLDREEARARERLEELERRLVQLDGDMERERKLVADAQAALERLAAEEEPLKRDQEKFTARRGEVDERVTQADTVLAAAEKTFGELTGTLADLTARRNQLESGLREQSERSTRLEREIADVESGLAQLDAAFDGRPDLSALAETLQAAQTAVTEAEAAALRAEAAHSGARQALEVARAPLVEADRRANRLETEAKTLAKLLHVDAKNLWPSVIDNVSVEKGYETALGAALGDDLEAPVDPSAPMRWGGAPVDPSDPALPEGATPLANYVQAPPELARRLAQIAVVDRADVPRLVSQLKTGQRLVSRDGDLWRWDGFAVSAHAPTGAARRLAERNRLADIEAELQVARVEADAKRRLVEEAQAEIAVTSAAETQARDARREAQRAADAAREQHAAAERELNAQAARRSALMEAKTRLAASKIEAETAQADAQHALSEMAPSAAIEEELAAVRLAIVGHRGALAEVRAEAQALMREAEGAERRL